MADTARKAETMNELVELDPNPWLCGRACGCGRRARRADRLDYWPHYPVWSPREVYSQDLEDYEVRAGGSGVE